MPHFNFSVDVVTIAVVLLGGIIAFRDRFALIKQLEERQSEFEKVVKGLTEKIAELTLALSELRIEFHEYRKADERYEIHKYRKANEHY